MIKEQFKKSIDVFLCILIILLSLKKGGFYNNDINFFSVGIIAIIISYLIYFIIDKKYMLFKNIKFKQINILSVIKKYKIQILFLTLSISYFLPVVFKTYADLNDSILEALRYVMLFIIFIIIYFSDNKKYYINTCIIIAFLQSVIGIDGLSNRYLTNILNSLDSRIFNNKFTKIISNYTICKCYCNNYGNRWYVYFL